MAPVSRREFLGYTAALPFLLQFHELAAAQRKRVKIRDVQVMMLQGGAHLHARQDHGGRRAVRHRRGVRKPRRRREGAGPLAEAVAGREGSARDRRALHARWARARASLSGTRTDGSAHNLIRAVSGIEMALWDLAGKILDVPTSTLLGGKFRDRVRVYDHAAPKNMLDKASVPEWAAQGRRRTRAASPATSSGSRTPIPRPIPARDPSNRMLTTQRADQHAAGIRELPRSDRLGSRPHGALPLGIRPAHVDSDRRRGGVDQAGLARGSAAGRLLRFVEAAVRELEGADLHGREPRAPRRVQGLHPQSGGATSCIPTCATPAASSRPSASPTWRTSYGLPMANHNTGSQVHTYATASGPRRSAITCRSRRSPAKAAGWIRCWCSTARTSRTASSRSAASRDWASR